MVDHWSEDSAPYNLVHEGRDVRIGDVYLGGDGRLWWISDIDAIDGDAGAVEERTARHGPVPGDVVRVYRRGDEDVVAAAAAELRRMAEGDIAGVSKAAVEEQLAAIADRLAALTDRAGRGTV